MVNHCPPHVETVSAILSGVEIAAMFAAFPSTQTGRSASAACEHWATVDGAGMATSLSIDAPTPADRALRAAYWVCDRSATVHSDAQRVTVRLRGPFAAWFAAWVPASGLSRPDALRLAILAASIAAAPAHVRRVVESLVTSLPRRPVVEPPPARPYG